MRSYVLGGLLFFGGCQFFIQPDPLLYSEVTDERCSDGVDNDEVDGTDCADPKCQDTSACRPCGNGQIDPGETCDDGNQTASDGCDPNCEPSGCANGFLAPEESCLELFATPDVLASSDWSGISLGNFDGDANPDIVVGDFGFSQVSVVFNNDLNNQPSLTPTSLPALASVVPDIATGDVNRDGLDDIIAPVKFSHSLAVITPLGGQQFNIVEDFTAGPPLINEVFGIAVADLNGDTKLDICSSNFLSKNLSVFLNDGDGNFDALAPVILDIAPDDIPERVAIGEINGDGIPDLATANTGSGNVSVLLSDGILSYTATTLAGFSGNPRDLALADLDGDGLDDLVIADNALDQIPVFLSSNGALTLKQTLGMGVGPGGFALSDIDKDGDRDIVVGSIDSEKVHIFYNAGLGDFPTTPTLITTPSALTRDVVVGDLNNDGFPDLAVLNTSSSQVAVYLNNP